MSASRVEEREKLPFPWGRYAGLLTATLVMFVGAALGNEPITILKRSFSREYQLPASSDSEWA
ncbi:MAG: hypothetical protein AAF394_14025 [Planctomycetota bacterium]